MTNPVLTAHDIRRHQRRARIRSWCVTVALLTVMTTLACCLLMMGETFYPMSQVLQVIQGKTVPGASYTVGELRLPRTILAVLVGLALGSAGMSFQTMLRNQLASPDIIGISAAASAVGVIGITMFHLDQWAVSALSLAGTLALAAAMYAFAHGGTRLILTGIGVGAFMNSIVVFVLSRANAPDLQAASRWMAGSLNVASWDIIVPVAVFVAVFLPALIVLTHHLSVLRLGDELATGLGLNTGRTRLVIMSIAVFLIAVVTAAVGPIAFVAFMAGPIAARLPHTNSVLTSALVGAILVLGADALAQLVLPYRYPVGVVTGALGAPFLIYLLIRTTKKGAGL
ncbi:iron ABC transporter permease [Corynebacterium sp. 320]|uniref:FecCD family ABC transporter permease n=1 Tax=Corynebacterium TaxID=1716 RepID=UPI00125CB969|nr:MULTISPECIES: iron ABC transporter permease [Corynebacterium]KAB1503924.1 iron ABC transporter permease [Corynebacterium sp. 320]KAB1552977.1 iron ABC transporter permease [Corynebacterium sp. 321]KAB1553803.1 iron ABC transporter permease [Corynebacterium sp. 319]KAB3528060.1 iron ABC transporter permease [Corynebacterium sp. 250]KAB3540452.1 iron ABC transporter permease [Corynebacterium sp. 366]